MELTIPKPNIILAALTFVYLQIFYSIDYKSKQNFLLVVTNTALIVFVIHSVLSCVCSNPCFFLSQEGNTLSVSISKTILSQIIFIIEHIISSQELWAILCDLPAANEFLWFSFNQIPKS